MPLRLQRNTTESDGKLDLTQFEGKTVSVDQLLKFCTENSCSDLYIKVESRPFITRWGTVTEVPCMPITTRIWNDWAKEAISSENNARYVRSKMLDLSYTIPMPHVDSDGLTVYDEYRYRVSAGFSMRKNIATFRMITRELPSFAKIKFPEKEKELLREVFEKRQGIVLFVGVTGSGKSIVDDQMLTVTRNGNMLLITWDQLHAGDVFQDGSVVLEVMPWERRPCFVLQDEDGETLVASDEHLVCCTIDGSMPSSPYGDSFAHGYASVLSVFEAFESGKRILLQPSKRRIVSVSPYCANACGDAAKDPSTWKSVRCRCVRTDTGHYDIGNFRSHNTTTMAACMNDYSQIGGPMQHTTIISLEDPIEYILPSNSHVNILQKEFSVDFKTWPDGVRQALREHPNFINVGETRDRETIETLVEAARTGHFVVSSFHSSDVSDTIARMYNMLVGQNEGVMYDVITNLNMILCQKLLPADDGAGFKLVTQYMVFTDQIRAHLNRALEAGENIPMTVSRLFDDPELVSQGVLKDWS